MRGASRDDWALSIYKPWGRTTFGVATVLQASDVHAMSDRGNTRNVRNARNERIIIAVVAALVGTIVIMHLTGHGLGHHGV